MSTFTDPLDLRDNGDETFSLLSRFRYHVGEIGSGEVIDVPPSFKTDFASIPRLFWNIIPPYGKHGKAAVIHDYLYRTGGYFGRYSRKRCDEIFLEAMRVLGVGAFKAGIMFRAVRIFGASSFQPFPKK